MSDTTWMYACVSKLIQEPQVCVSPAAGNRKPKPLNPTPKSLNHKCPFGWVLVAPGSPQFGSTLASKHRHLFMFRAGIGGTETLDKP